MKVLYQPTQDQPGDWLECDSSEWASLGGPFDIHALCIQGMVLDGADHYAVEEVSPGVIRAVLWYDDLEDWPRGQRWAREVLFHPLAPDLDPLMGGAWNTRIEQVVYAEKGIRQAVFEGAYAGNPKVSVIPFSRFDPDRVAPRPGRWVSDGLHEAHGAARAVRGWREWTDGVDPRFIGPDGELISQRRAGLWVRPKGTRTYYHHSDNLAVGFVTADNENAFLLTASTPAAETSNVGVAGQNSFSAATPENEPDTATWPTTGTYRYQLDATTVGSDVSFGLLTQGSGADGGFHRVTSDLATSRVKVTQSQSAFTSSGLHLASVTNPNFNGATPLQSDRFAIVVSAYRTAGHGSQPLTFQLNEADDYADGPWPAAAAKNIFLGCNF